MNRQFSIILGLTALTFGVLSLRSLDDHPTPRNLCNNQEAADIIISSAKNPESAFYVYEALEKKGFCKYETRQLVPDKVYKKVETSYGTLEVVQMTPDAQGEIYYWIQDVQ